MLWPHVTTSWSYGVTHRCRVIIAGEHAAVLAAADQRVGAALAIVGATPIVG